MKHEELLRKAYDPETFRAEAHQLVDLLADSLNKASNGDLKEVLSWCEPAQAFNEVESLASNPKELFESTLKRCIQLHDPRFLGHQITPPLPIAALAGLFSDFVNNGMGVYEMGMAGTAMERFVIQKVAKQMNLGDNADGVLTSGGSLGNLTALLAARSKIADADVWNTGTDEPYSVMVSDQAHYCVDRSVRIMGWGADGTVLVPTDECYRMDIDVMKRSYLEARQRGRKVIAVIGSACCTSTGTFDDLKRISDFCQENELWFHVDGAHGGACAFSKKYKYLIDGIEFADSVVMDFHKLLMTPAITTALIFRNGFDGYQAFAQKAQYLWSEAETPEWFNLAKRTFECTKTMMSLKVFSILTNYGTEIFDANVTKLTDLAKAFAANIREQPDFEVAVEPETNIVCYRYVGDCSSGLSLNDLNRQLRQSILTKGNFYIVQTLLNGDVWLRSTISNPFTTIEHLQALLRDIRKLAMSH